jgi:folate-binding protein YgfZ
MRPDRGRIVVSGRDRASFLQGLLTNDVLALGAGRGCYAAYLTPQGRMVTDLWVYELGDVMLLVMNGDRKDALLARLDQLVFAEDVQLGDVTGTFGAAAVVGPDAAGVVSRVTGVDGAELTALPEHGNMRRELDGRPVVLLQVGDLGEPGYEVLVEASQLTTVADALRQAGAKDMDAAAVEAVRLEAGIPRFGVDMDEETIPLEAGIESRALSFTKGCYVGQEVIVRVLHRGHGRVARKLVGMIADGPVGRGAQVRAEGKDVGEVTSSSFSPRLQQPIALGYVHRDSASPGTPLTIEGVSAVVSPVPFRRHDEQGPTGPEGTALP